MLVNIFCEVDDFCKFLSEKTELSLLGKDKTVGPKRGLTIKEFKSQIFNTIAAKNLLVN